CLDGIGGNGSCSCQEAFKGVACHICVDPSKHGERCDQGSGGVCRRGSCLEGFSGDNCDRMAAPCNSDGLHEHCHIHAYCVYAEPDTNEGHLYLPRSYAGDGTLCYGSLQDKYRHFSDDLSGNLTLLLPSADAMLSPGLTQSSFWRTRHHLPAFVRSHLVPGIYSIEDLDRLVGTKLGTMNPPTVWEVSKCNGVRMYTHMKKMPILCGSGWKCFSVQSLCVGHARILAPNLPALNGYIHIIDRDSSVVKYHVIPNELLFPDLLWDGMVKRTMLGVDHQVQFHVNSINQMTVNNVPLDSFTETQYGVIVVLPQVLQVQRNRCSKPFTVQARGRCTDCDGLPVCLFGYQPVRERFPANMRPNCNYRKRDHSCCPGYYGHECFRCPGEVGRWCSGHGECQDGAQGTGECRCYEGFHGTACEDCEPGRYGTNCSSKIVDDACGGVCDDNANCVPGPQGSTATCACVAGYEGNGTHCKGETNTHTNTHARLCGNSEWKLKRFLPVVRLPEVDPCSSSNGGCSEFAICTKLAPGERSCTCEEGYTGDGTVCLEIDGCLVNNGGCARSAECIRTGPNTAYLILSDGFYVGDFLIQPMRLGLGVACENELSFPKTGGVKPAGKCLFPSDVTYWSAPVFCPSERSSALSQKANVQNLLGSGPFTVFVPVERLDNQNAYEEWKDSARLQDLVRYHVVSCELLRLSDLKSTQRAVSTSGYTLHFSQQQMNLTSAAVFYGYTRFYKLIEEAGLLPALAMAVHQPFTMLWPTDEALGSLPPERQRWLSSPDHREELAAIIKAHIIRPSSTFRTMHGSKLRFSCDRTLVGAVLVNDNAARMVDRYLTFREGLAYGIDHLLEPPGLGAHCDTLENRTTYGEWETCSIRRSRGRSWTLDWYSYRHYPWLNMDGCRRVCRFPVWLQKCCKNHYGRDCQGERESRWGQFAQGMLTTPVATTGTAATEFWGPDDAVAAKASGEVPATCVSPATTAPTAQVARTTLWSAHPSGIVGSTFLIGSSSSQPVTTVESGETVTMEFRVLESVSAERAGRGTGANWISVSMGPEAKRS
ncbi:unnamed protein product, partial [Tetraodon nigroviridis]